MDTSYGVSVVIPTYNRADLLPEAIDSALQQDWPLLEIVVVDDGSSDDTARVLSEYANRHPSVVKVIRQPNAGESRARNEGIRSASHRYVALLDSDNAFLPGKLQKQMRLMLNQPELGFTFTGYNNFGDVPLAPVILPHWEVSPRFALEQLLIGCYINTSTVIATKEVFLESGLFDPSLRCCQDHDLWLRIAAAGVRIGYVAEALTNYRVHGEGVSSNLSLVNESTEQVFDKLFSARILPKDVQGRKNYYMARCYLNSASRSLSSRDGTSVRTSLLRASKTYPLSIRPGWLLMYLRSLFLRPEAVQKGMAAK